MSGFGVFSGELANGQGKLSAIEVRDKLADINGMLMDVSVAMRLLRSGSPSRFKSLDKSMAEWVEDLDSLKTRIQEAKRGGPSWWK